MKFIIVLISLVSVSTVFAQNKTYTSSSKKVHLLELYSSQGCSSCPPAERWLSKQKTNPNLWKTFVPLEFHVDYWNYLGWVDKFSKKEFATRQRSYSKEWGKRTVYTPQFTLDGGRTQNGHQYVPEKAGEEVGVLKVVQVKGNTYKATFKPTGLKTKSEEGFRLFGAIMGNGLNTKVTAGENTGETLVHEFVVLSFAKKDMKKSGENSFSMEFTLPEKHKSTAKSFSTAFWVTSQKSLKPVQAVGGSL